MFLLHMTTQQRPRGFTLVELLVVIAILALLASLLLPTLMHARERGRIATCTSNEHQLGIAVLVYAQDHGETFPTGDWQGAVMGMLGGGDAVLRCPTAGTVQSYGLTTQLDGAALGQVRDPVKTVMVAESREAWVNCYHPITRPHENSCLWTFVDGHTTRYTTRRVSPHEARLAGGVGTLRGWDTPTPLPNAWKASNGRDVCVREPADATPRLPGEAICAATVVRGGTPVDGYLFELCDDNVEPDNEGPMWSYGVMPVVVQLTFRNKVNLNAVRIGIRKNCGFGAGWSLYARDDTGAFRVPLICPGDALPADSSVAGHDYDLETPEVWTDALQLTIPCASGFPQIGIREFGAYYNPE
jgi:prepilin-type N-terminal cleavage/methylation domain-containing protein